MSLVVRIGANIDGFDREMRNFRRQVNDISKDWRAVGQEFQRVGSTLTRSVTAPLVGIGTASVMVGKSFEQSMANLQSASGASAQDMARLESAAMDMGRTTRFGARQAADALFYMSQSGKSVEESLGLLPHVSNLALAGNMELSKSAEMVMDSLNAMGYGVGDAERMIDLMTVASNNSHNSIQDLGAAFINGGSTAQQMSGGMQEYAAALMVLGNNGIRAGEAGTAMRMIMRSLTAPTDQAANMMNKLGLEVFDVHGNIRPLNSIMGDLQGVLSGMTEEGRANVMSTIFNAAQLDAATHLVNGANGSLLDMKYLLGDVSGAGGEMADIMGDTLSNRLGILRSNLENIGIMISGVLIPPISRLVEFITKWLQRLGELSPEMVALIVLVGTIAAAIGPLLLIVGKLITAFSQVSAVIKVLKGGMALKLAPFALKIGAVLAAVAAIGLLVYALIQAFQTNEEFRERIIAVFTGIWERVEPIVLGIRDVVVTAFEGIRDFISQHGETILAVAVRIFELIGKYVKLRIDMVVETVKFIWNGLATFWANSGEGIVSTTRAFLANVWQAFQNILRPIQAFAIEIIATIVEFWREHGEQFFQAVRIMLERVVEVFMTRFNKVLAFIQFIAPVIRLLFEMLWNSIKGAVEFAWVVITNVIRAGVEIIHGIVRIFSGIFTGDWSAIWDGVTRIFRAGADLIVNIISGFVQMMIGRLQGLGTFFSGTFQHIFDFLRNIDLRQIGVNIIQGLINGIGSGMQAVADTVRNVGRTITNGIRGFLGINSPSRVMIEVGEYTGDGLVKGLENRFKDIMDISQKMGALSVPNVNVANSMNQLSTIAYEPKKQPIQVVLNGRVVGEMLADDVQTAQNRNSARAWAFS